MEGLGLLIGHLVGDYLLQNDWMARHKASPPPGATPYEANGHGYAAHLRAWHERFWASHRGNLACTLHCLLYTLAVWLGSYRWMPLWGLVACYAAHWPMDRYRLARWWMAQVAGQKEFATGPLAPWSVIVVDNTFHLLTLYLIALAAGAL